jgi:hypothetical protein
VVVAILNDVVQGYQVERVFRLGRVRAGRSRYDDEKRVWDFWRGNDGCAGSRCLVDSI